MNDKLINIAFCFDDRLWMQAGVTITSLLCVSKDKCNYNIYCIVSPSINKAMQGILESLVKKHSTLSTINFFTATNQIDNIKYNKRSTYYRLLLPQIFTDINKIIYADVDIVFNSDLQELDAIDINNYYVAGVKDSDKNDHKSTLWDKYKLFDMSDKGQYINAGILIMNLEKIRQDNIDEKWIQLCKENFPFHDQDIINISCAGKVLLLQSKWNFYGECIFHFAGNSKPWNVWDSALKYNELWWYYAAKTLFYPYFLKDINQQQCDRIFKVLPKWLGKFFCWFVLKRENRRRFEAKYIKGM